MYELRRGHHYHYRPSKRLLLVEWLLSFVVATGLVFGGWFVYAGVLQGRQVRPTQQNAVQAEPVKTCIATGSAANGSQPEVCPEQ